MYCKSCGAALPDDAAFCPECGTKIAEKRKPEKSPLCPVRCTACGSNNLKKLYKGGFRCEHCGTVFYSDERDAGTDREELDAKVAVLLSEAAKFAEKKDYHNELQKLSEAKKFAPEDNTVLLRLGRAYWRLGSIEKAMEYYHMAEELYPDDPSVYNNIGSAYFKLGHYAEAKAQYEKAVALIASDPMSSCAEDTAITYGNYAYCLGKLGDRENARKYLSIAKEKGYSKESINTICKDLRLNRFLI